MSETTQAPPSTGKTAIAGAVISILGIVAAVKPQYVPVIGAIQQALPQVQEAIGIVIASVGTVVTAVGHPPKWLRKLFGRK